MQVQENSFLEFSKWCSFLSELADLIWMRIFPRYPWGRTYRQAGSSEGPVWPVQHVAPCGGVGQFYRAGFSLSVSGSTEGSMCSSWSPGVGNACRHLCTLKGTNSSCTGTLVMKSFTTHISTSQKFRFLWVEKSFEILRKTWDHASTKWRTKVEPILGYLIWKCYILHL